MAPLKSWNELSCVVEMVRNVAEYKVMACILEGLQTILKILIYIIQVLKSLADVKPENNVIRFIYFLFSGLFLD